MRIHIALIVACAAAAHAQDLSVGSAWRSTGNSRSPADRISIAQAGLDVFRQYYNESSGDFTGASSDFVYYNTPWILSAMARKDDIANTTDNKDFVMTALNKANAYYPGFSGMPPTQTCSSVNWGLTAVYAAMAYGNDAAMIALAKNVWAYVEKFTITEEQASSGAHPEKTVAFAGSCSGASVAGGVFYWTLKKNDLTINTANVGGFIALSGYLAELSTGSNESDTYKAAAIRSGMFLRNHLLASNGLVADNLLLSSSDTCNADTEEPKSVNVAFLLEGFSVLADITGDSSWKELVAKSLAATINNGNWFGTDGIIKVSETSTNPNIVYGKNMLIRAMHVPWERNPTNATIRSVIEAASNVQYNALMDLATSSGSNIYSPNWHGPAPTRFTPAGQLAAMDVISMPITFPQVEISSTQSSASNAATSATSIPTGSSTESTPPSTSTPPAATSTDTSHHLSNGLAIGLGAGLGAGVAIALALLAVFCLRRRSRHKAASVDLGSDYESAQPPTPFMTTLPSPGAESEKSGSRSPPLPLLVPRRPGDPLPPQAETAMSHSAHDISELEETPTEHAAQYRGLSTPTLLGILGARLRGGLDRRGDESLERPPVYQA